MAEPGNSSIEKILVHLAEQRLSSSTWAGPIFLSCLSLLAIGLLSIFQPGDFSAGNKRIKAPVVGPGGVFARWYFYKNAWLYIEEGYRKFPAVPFKLSGNDIVVLPARYVNELKSLPDDKLSSIQANIDNFEGLHSTTSLLLEGNLHTRTIQSKLTPKLGTLIPASQDSLNNALEELLPAISGQYTSVPAFDFILQVVARVASRHFVGHPMCESREWLDTALQYTENAFRTIIVLRIFPNWLKPWVSLFIPYSYKVTQALSRAKSIVAPIVRARREAEQSNDASYVKPTDFLQMMMDSADEFEGTPEKLAHRLLILILAAQHTTSMAACQALYDLCARREFVHILREEVEAVVGEDGTIHKTSLTKMKKLDSFLRESQRLSPPSLSSWLAVQRKVHIADRKIPQVGFKRAVRADVVLSDGLTLPRGAHLMMPVYPLVVDPAIVASPMEFDGLRHFHARQQQGEANHHQFATTSDTNMHFGHGKFACPGRFFAASTIKLLLANLLMRYDFRLTEGQEELIDPSGRPNHLCVHEYVFPNPEAKVKFKLRA